MGKNGDGSISRHHMNQIDDLPRKYNNNFKNWKETDIKCSQKYEKKRMKQLHSSYRVKVTLLGNKTVISTVKIPIVVKFPDGSYKFIRELRKGV